MLATIRVGQAMLLGLAILYGTGECNVLISSNDRVYCLDVDCFPLRVSKVEYLNKTNNTFSLCATGNRTAEMVRTSIETFFNKQCPTTSAGPSYNKSYIDKVCLYSGKITSVQVKYNCSPAASTPQTGYTATTSSSVKGSLGFTLSDTTNAPSAVSESSLKKIVTTASGRHGSADSNSTTLSANMHMIGGDTVAAAICTSVGAVLIAFIAAYLWRRKLGNKCLSRKRLQDQEALSKRSSVAKMHGKEFGQCVYENCHSRQLKRSENEKSLEEALGDASSRTKEFNSQSTERNFLDAPCYLEVLPSDLSHDSVSQDDHCSTISKVQDIKEKEQHQNYYSSPSPSLDRTYFILEQWPVEPSNTCRNSATPTTETALGAEAEHRATAETDAFSFTNGTNQVSSQDDDLYMRNAENAVYVSYDDPTMPEN